jgi:hypothetical protein
MTGYGPVARVHECHKERFLQRLCIMHPNVVRGPGTDSKPFPHARMLLLEYCFRPFQTFLLPGGVGCNGCGSNFIRFLPSVSHPYVDSNWKGMNGKKNLPIAGRARLAPALFACFRTEPDSYDLMPWTAQFLKSSQSQNG